MTSARDVVITGFGIVSPIGVGRDEFERSLATGNSGIRPITQYDPGGLSVTFGGELDDFQPKLYVKPRKSLKVMSREIQMGVASASLAVEDAGLDVTQIQAERCGVVYGSPMLYADTFELGDLYRSCVVDDTFDFSLFGDQFPKQMLPLWLLKYLPNMTASHIGIAHGARGPNNSIVQGDVSSLLAIIEATTIIERGVADTMLAGGAGSRLALTGVVYRGDSNLSHRSDSPQQASRPFDADRDGMVIGEGAATFVLEERGQAEHRGADILGRIRGYAATFAGSAGMQCAIENSIRASLARAGVRPQDIGHVNAHGMSDPVHDVAEARAIRATLGDVAVTAVKSYFGNVGAAAGALELAASLQRIPSVPVTLNYQTSDPECDINVVTERLSDQASSVLKLSQAGTGQAAAVLVDRI